LTSIREEQIIAFCLVYTYLSKELEKNPEWSRLEGNETEEGDNLLGAVELDEFFTKEVIAFYNDNYEMIKQYLNQNK